MKSVANTLGLSGRIDERAQTSGNHDAATSRCRRIRVVMTVDPSSCRIPKLLAIVSTGMVLS